MPKPPDRPTSELDEVERAISALAGRHPEHERSRRETAVAAAQRRKLLEQELVANARRRRLRYLAIAVCVLAVAALGVIGWKLGVRASRLRESIAHEEVPFLAEGYEQVASNGVTGALTLDADAPGASCFVAVATEGNVTVHTPAGALPGARSVGWCSCAAGHVTLGAAGATSTAGLALLRIDGNVAGGPLARAWTATPPAAWGEGGAECADVMLDAWIADHRWPRPASTGTELTSVSGGGPLAAIGFHVSTAVADGTPFAVVDAAAGDCTLALAPGRDLSLRRTGGTRPIEHARDAMLWCGSVAETFTVWVEGGGRATIVSAPATRLGGLLGASEGVRIAGYTVTRETSWLRAEDQGWEAMNVLRASTVGEVVTGPLPMVPATSADMRVAAIVAPPSASVTWEPSLAAVACEPPIGPGSAPVESVCVPTIPSKLWQKGDAPGFAARGATPLWMSALAQRHEREVAALLPELLALARRLGREGFEPTTFEGVTELPDGVRVVGRAGEDAVVAVAIVPDPPWVLPYSSGAPWDLGDAPRVIALKPGSSVTLKASAPLITPRDKRRTVVFRHAMHP